MARLLLILLIFVWGGAVSATQAQSAADVPARPTPFRFVNDQAQLLSAADATTLENGLRRYADNNGTQIVVVTVPSLEGKPVAAYARALGAAWGLGQRDKNNGVVVLLGAQERAVTIQAGSGLRSQLTPAVTSRIISQMTSGFKQGNYFGGLKAGLNSLMYAADPNSAPGPAQPDAATPSTAPTAPAAAPGGVAASANEPGTVAPDPVPTAPAAAPEPESAGFGLSTLVLVVVVIGGGLWLVSKLFRRRNAPAAGSAPDFLPTQPTGPAGTANRGGYGPQQTPDFLSNRGGGSSGSGMGGILMTGAAAAAGAYLGNRMADRNDDAAPHLSPDAPARPLDAPATDSTGSGSAFPFLGNSAPEADPAPDYFAPDSPGNEPDYFSSDDASSYDDSSSDDTGGGGFDDTSDNSGSW
ncbi:TPM domain-containing protein [Hymenobacter metallilatus]|uniref:TPM domain-containing protein n=1 Tax=Hymenobacter metallilatus TaxID=2493666 RepID=A0A3R9NLD3_9BACT|nr:TPM domain-containing protein [Hymenobacter metallilatus]RSK31201.1 TPM domain-containing protein [Hymenobacter metallilatus]